MSVFVFVKRYNTKVNFGEKRNHLVPLIGRISYTVCNLPFRIGILPSTLRVASRIVGVPRSSWYARSVRRTPNECCTCMQSIQLLASPMVGRSHRIFDLVKLSIPKPSLWFSCANIKRFNWNFSLNENQDGKTFYIDCIPNCANPEKS